MCGCEVNDRRFFAFRVVNEGDLNKVLNNLRSGVPSGFFFAARRNA